MSSTVPPDNGSSVLQPAKPRVQGASLWWILGVSFVYLGLLFVGSHWPYEQLPWRELATRHDKALHVTSFALLTALAGCSIKVIGHLLRDNWLRKLCGSPLVLFGLLASYGLFDEISQKLAGRNCDWHDWAADLIGIGTGIVILSFANRLHFFQNGISTGPDG